MGALDTNVLVRWLVVDDAGQAEAVASMFDEYLRDRARLFVPVTVVLELEWVLRACYGFDKASVLAALDALLGVEEIEFQHESAVEVALWHYRPGGAPDFADCVHLALVSESARGPLLSFDRRTAKLDGVRRPS
ncbi:type II toxin-antitoxin system VapC family toxin [Thauera butanivorans]|uniref:type II toxin-antitoxin system VapC family toxin n=1 Tax=Thauera butanivorans TaxID=86174 RepID=UPI0008388030|nr:type II toxin-antitoxin system VapC family toxin [Thauera butanivorans]